MNYYLEGVLKWPFRARHSFGFGIHSPYGFSFITGVLRDASSGYYAYDELGEVASRHGRSEREARGLYRVLLHLRGEFGCPAELSSEGSSESMGEARSFLSEIAALAIPEQEPERLPLLLADSFKGEAEGAAEVVRERLAGKGGAFLLTGVNRSREGRRLRRLLLENPPAGIVFDGWHSMLVVARRGLPSQVFQVLFPR